ncbi:Ribosomal protein S2, bacteria/mitochondria/plastid,Ribosomal protein S2 [Cinara cedri]|uniref:Small ribosomal subunit protein uS2m n=2 Tax=Cinara cedri TaxID=506608 RepID=A0A5E4M4V4_9HEMI|nr:Ribosomal protein S2, bacteria/mitochondria/plastid,Ribosomal protein S2 [Cinara cedri]
MATHYLRKAFSKNLPNHIKSRICVSYLSTLPKMQHEDVQSSYEESKFKLSVPDAFDVNRMVKIKNLFEAGVHFGHTEGTLDDRMKPYLYGTRLGHLIINLNDTKRLLQQALNVIAHISYRGGVILFLCQSPLNCLTVENCAKECGEYAHTRYWRSGMFTNSSRIFKSETRLPDLCIVLNTLSSTTKSNGGQHSVLSDAAKMLIPTIAIVDTDTNPNLVTYPIPGNDDTPSAITLYCDLFKNVILKAKDVRKNVLNNKNNMIEA